MRFAMMPPQPKLFADPSGLFVHDLVLAAADRHPEHTAIVDTSDGTRLDYDDYADLVDSCARNLIAAGIRPGERVAIFLPNCWEFCVAFHGASLAGAVPTPLNPSYREREVRYQLENSGAAFLITDGRLIDGIDLGGLPELRRLYVTRSPTAAAAESFSNLLRSSDAAIPSPADSPQNTLAVLPYSSGTTGLPKGVMLTHANLVTNAYQMLGNIEYLDSSSVTLLFLPLYHIYGMNVVLNPVATLAGTLVLMPRWDMDRALDLIVRENVTWTPLVPPVVALLTQAAEAGRFPREHRVRGAKCGAAPLPPEVVRRFTALTGIRIGQGYGMTETSPVTHMGSIRDPWYRPEAIGFPVACTDCRIIGENEQEVAPGEAGELLMRGPQIMRGYWKAPDATQGVLRDGWFWSGDVARQDEDGFYFIVDRRKEMIKYKGFAVAPAEVEAVLLEHPAVEDCGVVGRADDAAGEIPCAFVVLRENALDNQRTASLLQEFVAERLTHYKMPREIYFVHSLPRTASGKILRRELRKLL